MATRKKRSAQSIKKNKIQTHNPLDLKIGSLLTAHSRSKVEIERNQGLVIVIKENGSEAREEILAKMSPPWMQGAAAEKPGKDVFHFVTPMGPVWVVCRRTSEVRMIHGGVFDESTYCWHREQLGSILQYAKALRVSSVLVEFHHTTAAQEIGALVGIEMAAYSYKNLIDGHAFEGFPQIHLSKIAGQLSQETCDEAMLMSRSVNLCRHVVNTPPNFANPKTIADWSRKLLGQSKFVRCEVWDHQRLRKEGMGMHLGVGQGSENLPCLVHIQYRPKGIKTKPIAFVGKGVTFDTGGLDIKPSSGMRLMKKDMGGVGALIGLANWAIESQVGLNLDFYLGLAENCVDSKSMRPSDVLTARNGMKVEIHNTDAEGRLVLGDALDVAATRTKGDEPQIIIDTATLTGAIKTALGGEVAGLFSNDDELAAELLEAAQKSGEHMWRMPLYQKYCSGMTSQFADLNNCVDGFGGAITAALFLEKFVKGKPWAHLDIYAWSDKSTGSLSAAGASGQAVQALIKFLKNFAKK